MKLPQVGFTGTRHGMTSIQYPTFDAVLAQEPLVLHHGDCVGADADAHRTARQRSNVSVVVHPPTDSKLRAFCDYDLLLAPLPYMDRNRAIVDASDVLIACPYEIVEPEFGRSGTWSTIRYALLIPNFPSRYHLAEWPSRSEAVMRKRYIVRSRTTT